MSNIEVVVSVSDLRYIDDSEYPHMKAILVEGFSWFLLDRNSREEDDGRSHASTRSGKGRWAIMTPQTAGFVGTTIASSSSNEEDWIRHPHIEEPAPELLEMAPNNQDDEELFSQEGDESLHSAWSENDDDDLAVLVEPETPTEDPGETTVLSPFELKEALQDEKDEPPPEAA